MRTVHDRNIVKACHVPFKTCDLSSEDHMQESYHIYSFIMPISIPLIHSTEISDFIFLVKSQPDDGLRNLRSAVGGDAGAVLGVELC